MRAFLSLALAMLGKPLILALILSLSGPGLGSDPFYLLALILALILSISPAVQDPDPRREAESSDRK
eukprot:gene30079-35044_t